MSVEQRQGTGEGAANVCNHEGVAVGGDRDHAVHRCTEVQAMAGVAVAVVTGAGMLLNESEEVRSCEVECNGVNVGDGMVMDECMEVLCDEVGGVLVLVPMSTLTIRKWLFCFSSWLLFESGMRCEYSPPFQSRGL